MNLTCLNTQIYFQNDKLTEMKKIIQSFYHEEEAFIITDKNVYRLYGEKLKEALSGYKLYFIVLKPGEKAKSIKTYSRIINKLIEQKITRKHLLIALGGGVVGDLTGFVAATILRGISYIQIPTTLLAQVDSSIGGKTGINMQKGKNLVGSFYAPKLVIVDTVFLKTLPENVYQDGIVEMLKIALLKDHDLWMKLKENKQVNTALVNQAVKAKVSIVEQDEYDQGLRQTLNFGHTFGHAIEKYYKYKISHGKAIAYGMLLALELGKSPDKIYQELKEILIQRKIIAKPFTKISQVAKLLEYDKKRMPEGLSFIILLDYQKPKQIWLKDLIE
ncbi:MAG: 3-dehydroquinate synthase [Acholeplasmataceae bacterium]